MKYYLNISFDVDKVEDMFETTGEIINIVGEEFNTGAGIGSGIRDVFFEFNEKSEAEDAANTVMEQYSDDLITYEIFEDKGEQ